MRNKGFQKICRWLIAFLIVIYPFSPLSNNLMVSKAEGSYILNFSSAGDNVGNVTASNNTNNNTSISNGGSVTQGDTVALTAGEGNGGSFYKWEGLPSTLTEGSAESPSVIFTMPGNDLNITARFISNTSNRSLTLAVDPEIGGSVAGTAIGIDDQTINVNNSPQPNSVPGGSYVTIVATPSEGYSFKNWGLPEGLSVTENQSASNISFYMPNSDTTVTAYFIKNVSDRNLTLSVDPQGAGSIQGQVTVEGQSITGVTETQENSVPEGATVTLSATPNDGYYFLRWNYPESLELTSQDGANIEFTMPGSDVSITAQFAEINALTFRSSDNAKGTVSGLVNEQYIDSESNVSPESPVVLEATPRYGYEFVRWEFSNEFSDYTVDNQKVSFLMPSHSLTVVAYFKATEYGFTLAVDPSKGGVIKDKDGNVVNLGTIHYSQVPQMTRSLIEASFTTNPLDYTAEPNPGYKFKNWVVAMGEDYTTSRLPEGWNASLTNTSQSIQLNSSNFLLPIYSGFVLTAVFEKEEVPVTEPTTDSPPIDTNTETDTTFPKTSDDFNPSLYAVTMLLSAGMYFFLKIRDGKRNKEAEKA